MQRYPGETAEMFNLLKFYVDRWAAKMKEVEKDLWFKQAEALDQAESQAL